MDIVEIPTYKYKVDHNSATASKYYHIGFHYNGNYPIFTSDGTFAGVLTAKEIKQDYKPAKEGQGWKGTF